MSAPAPRKPKRPLEEESKDANEQATKYAKEQLLKKMVLIQGAMAKQSRDINLLIAAFLRMTSTQTPEDSGYDWDGRKREEVSSLRLINRNWNGDLPSSLESVSEVYYKSLLWVHAWSEKNKDELISPTMVENRAIVELKGLVFPDATSLNYFVGNNVVARRMAWEKFLATAYGWDAAEQERRLVQFRGDMDYYCDDPDQGKYSPGNTWHWDSLSKGVRAPASKTGTALEMLLLQLQNTLSSKLWEFAVVAACRAYGKASTVALLWIAFHFRYHPPSHYWPYIASQSSFYSHINEVRRFVGDLNSDANFGSKVEFDARMAYFAEKPSRL